MIFFITLIEKNTHSIGHLTIHLQEHLKLTVIK